MEPNEQSDEPDRMALILQRLTNIVTPLAILAIVVAFYWIVISPMIAPIIMPKPDVHAGVGETMTFLELRPLTGNVLPISLPELRDHVTLLNFWGVWCPPCREELPHIAALQQRFAGREDFSLLAVSCPSGSQMGDTQALHDETAGLLKKLNLKLPTYHDPDQATQVALSGLLSTRGFGYPTTVLVDRRGVIRAVWIGYRLGAETEMERYISELLDEENK